MKAIYTMTGESRTYRQGFPLATLVARSSPFLLVILFLAAFLPRLCAIDRYITPDELTWVFRSIQFREAILDHRWADTSVAGHPGATTTWLGAMGMSIQMLLQPGDREIYEWLTHLAWMSPDLIPAFPRLSDFLTAPRLAVALVTSLGIVAISGLGRPLFGRRAAYLGAFFLALDPFFAGHSGLLHVDGLAATFTTLSLLLLANAYQTKGSSQIRYTMAAGGLAAFSVMTKSPTMVLIPVSGLVLFLLSFRKDSEEKSFKERFGRFLLLGCVWVFVFALVAILLLPAMWTAPDRAFDIVTRTANRHAGSALRETFFMGKAAMNHGPSFYPTVLAFRIGPLVLAGLALGFYWIIKDRRFRSASILLLLSWAPIFLGTITFAAKKFDRYALPVIPALILVAAASWDQLIARITLSPDRGTNKSSTRAMMLSALLIVIQVILLLRVVPYPLAFYNPLVGGAKTDERVMTIGWGDEVGAAAQWLADQPDSASTTASASCSLCLAAFFPGQTLPFDERHLPQAEYLIMSANGRQLDPEAFAKQTAGATLVHTAQVGGLDYSWVYRQANPSTFDRRYADLATPLWFDNRVQIHGTGIYATSDWVEFAVRWSLAQPGGRYTVQIVLRDEWGHTWGNIETPLLNEVNFFPEHWNAGEETEVVYTLELPAGIPPADYTVEVALFDAKAGDRLALLGNDGSFQGVVYSHKQIQIPYPNEPRPLDGLYVPIVLNANMLDDSLTLLGYKELEKRVWAGSNLELELFWLPHAPLPEGLQLEISLGDSTSSVFPISRAPSGEWKPESLIHEKYTLPVPPDQQPGTITLEILPLSAQGAPLIEADSPTIKLAPIDVKATDRLFELPADMQAPLDLLFGDSIKLRGMSVNTTEIKIGQPVTVNLYWQAEDQPRDTYTAFVHLIAPDGSIPAQADRLPGNSPSNTWAAGQVIVDSYTITIPQGAPTGTYQIATGLYEAKSGLRRPLFDEMGARIANDRALLPVTLMVRPVDG